MQQNKLLNLDLHNIDLDYKDVTVNDFKEALKFYFPKVEKEYTNFESIKASQLKWENFELGFQYERKLSFVYSLLSFYKSIKNTKELNEIFNSYQEKINTFFTKKYTDKKFYSQLISYKSSEEFQKLDFEKQKYIDLYIQSFEKRGVHLSEECTKKLVELNLKLSKLKNDYNLNLQKCRDSLFYEVDIESLNGLSEEHINKIKSLPFNIVNGKKIYRINYSTGLFAAIQTYCRNKSIRNDIFSLLSSIGVKDPYNNIAVAQSIVDTTHEIAQLLNYENASSMFMSENMAKDSQTVFEFLEDLRIKSHNSYIEETKEYISFAKNIVGEDYNYADRAYILNKMYEEKFNIDTISLKKYFPASQVINGMFTLLNKLYSIEFVKREEDFLENAPIYALYSKDKKEHIGDLILDLYQRDGKRNGACCGNLISKEVYDTNNNLNSLPLVFIICNVEPGSSNEQALFSFEDIITLFHEMGHALHHFFSENKLGYFNGTSKVQRDAVELPSQFMENFCYNAEVLKDLSLHIETNEKIPTDIINKLIESKNFLSATSLMRHILASYIDMKIYSEVKSNVSEVEKQAISKHILHTEELDALIETPKLFHIFTAGYSAGLYSYKWAEVLAIDAFYALQEQGSSIEEQKEMALKFKNTIYADGGLSDMNDNFIKFLGRKYSNLPFLTNLGINTEEKIKNKNTIGMK